MRKLIILTLVAAIMVACSCTQKTPDGLVLVKGGTFVNTKSNYYGKGITLPDFYIGKYEVTQKEWQEVMGSNPSEKKGAQLPVETVSWYDCVEYCNKRSLKEGLQPYYNINKHKQDPYNTNELDNVKWAVTINEQANGYRLPSEAEWEYAAGGGQASKSYTFSGSDNIDEVAWYWKNAGDKYLTGNWLWSALEKNHNRARPVGGKKANELGIYDMSGNVREWCGDRHTDDGNGSPQGRIWKGGGWIGADFCCESTFRAGHQANGKGPDQGLRVCRGI